MFSTGEDLLETVPDPHSVELLDPDLFNCILILRKFFQVPSESGSKSFENGGSESGSALAGDCQCFPTFIISSFLDPDFIGSTDSDLDWESGFGSGQAKLRPRKRKKNDELSC